MGGLEVGLHYMTNYSYSADTCLAVSGVVNIIILYFFLSGRNRGTLKSSFDSKRYYENSSNDKHYPFGCESGDKIGTTLQLDPIDSLLLLRLIYAVIVSGVDINSLLLL